MTPGYLLRRMMTLNFFSETLHYLLTCWTLRRIFRRTAWSLLPILKRGGLQHRFRVFPLRTSQRRRSMRSARGLSWPMHIFQSFSKSLMALKTWKYQGLAVRTAMQRVTFGWDMLLWWGIKWFCLGIVDRFCFTGPDQWRAMLELLWTIDI